MGSKTELVQYFHDYLEQHPNDSKTVAVLSTLGKALEQVGLAGLAGTLSGGLFGNTGVAVNKVQTATASAMGRDIMGKGLQDTVLQPGASNNSELTQTILNEGRAPCADGHNMK